MCLTILITNTLIVSGVSFLTVRLNITYYFWNIHDTGRKAIDWL